jgi:hypothetical protein
VRVGAYSGTSASRWRRATALALLILLLMPINYRAGAAVPHAHALIQLIFEAQSGVPVHHHGVNQLHGEHGGDVATSQSGAPAIQIFASTGLLPLVLVALLLQPLRPAIRPGSDAKRTGRSLAPGHPPPQRDLPT